MASNSSESICMIHLMGLLPSVLELPRQSTDAGRFVSSYLNLIVGTAGYEGESGGNRYANNIDKITSLLLD